MTKKKLKVCWISAGISSFMAGYLAVDVDEWIYIDIADQHPDSMRFIKDCEKAIGKKITVLRSTEYRNVEDCVRAFGGYKNPANGFAPCTNWLKSVSVKNGNPDTRITRLLMCGDFTLRKLKGLKEPLKLIHRRNMSFH